MDAKEFRIGNLFNDRKGNTLMCFGVTREDHEHGGIVWYDEELGFYENVKDVKPIPLTEEWLLKMGFEKLTTKKPSGYKSSIYAYGGSASLCVCFDDGRLSVDFWQGNEKKYVHELQNFIFALTGEELKINA